MAKQMPAWAQWVCVIVTYAVMFLLWEYGIPWLLFSLQRQIIVTVIAGILTLLLYLKPAASYHVKPYLWLIGVPFLPACKLMLYPDDFADIMASVRQQRMTTLMIYAAVPILFCIFGYLIHAIQVRRWRVGK
ncbi:MAG: hypothetical protein IJC75_00975 [Oscillospiraceae bacterium]|nr:hypothetical protein [Oscillospiraceae bacterium]